MQTLPERRSASNTIPGDFAMDQLVAALGRALNTRRGSGSFERAEQSGIELCNEALRRTLEEELQRRADDLGEELLVDGKLCRRHEPGTVTYHSLCGPLEVRRYTYREQGVRNGPTVVPLEIAAGLLHRATPALASAVGLGYADRTTRALAEDFQAAGRVPPSRSTLERMAVKIGTDVKGAVGRIEPALRRCERIPKEAVAITIGLDRTTVPMLEEATEGKQAVQYRMAYVGTVCITNRDVEALQIRRYAAPAHEGPAQLLSRVKADLGHAMRQRPDLNVAVVQDGAPELWGLVGDLLDELGLKKSAVRRIDRYHATQYMNGALDALRVPPPIKAKILDRWKHELDTKQRAIDRITAEIEEMQRGLPEKMFHDVHRFWNYLFWNYLFCNYRLIRYATLHKLGIPEGSGVTEAACKSLITWRTKRCGQRWTERGVIAITALVSIVHSDRWARFWKSFTKASRKSLELIRA